MIKKEIERKELSKSCIFGSVLSVLNRDFPKLTSLSFSLRPSVLRHVMYTIVDRYDNERETWNKSNFQLARCGHSKLLNTAFSAFLKSIFHK
jgi:hypothetical protein